MNDETTNALDATTDQAAPVAPAAVTAPVISSVPATPVAPATAETPDGAYVEISRKLDICDVSTSMRGRLAGPDGRRQRVAARPTGAGVMGQRAGDLDESMHRAAVDDAKHAARTSGHRFDLMRYLRLRRTREPT